MTIYLSSGIRKIFDPSAPEQMEYVQMLTLIVRCGEWRRKKADNREKMRILARLTVKKFVNYQIIVSTGAKIWYNSV